MYVVLLLAALAILGGVVVIAMGGGGEMALFPRDLPATGLDLRSPADIAMLRLPLGPLGYQVQATSEALAAAANLLAARDAEIAALRGELWRLGSGGRDEPSETAERAAERTADRTADKVQGDGDERA